MNTYLAARMAANTPKAAAHISAAQGVSFTVAATAVLIGLVLFLHHKRKSPRVIGWLTLLIGIVFGVLGLLSGVISSIAGMSLWGIPVFLVATAYIGGCFIHDGTRKWGGQAHRWLQPIYGLVLPTLVFAVFASLGTGAKDVLSKLDQSAHSTSFLNTKK